MKTNNNKPKVDICFVCVCVCVDKYLHKLNVKTWPKGMQLFRIVQKGLETQNLYHLKMNLKNVIKRKLRARVI